MPGATDGSMAQIGGEEDGRPLRWCGTRNSYYINYIFPKKRFFGEKLLWGRMESNFAETDDFVGGGSGAKTSPCMLLFS